MHAEHISTWGGERNNNMLEAGFVETPCLFPVILNHI